MSDDHRPDSTVGGEDEATAPASAPQPEPSAASREATPRDGGPEASASAPGFEGDRDEPLEDPVEEWERVREAHGRHRHHHRHGHRKERILHTRISEQLSRDIRQLAEELRLPVSNLVRNVLEESFSAVERMSGDVGEILEEVLGEAERANERFYRARHRHRDRAERARERADRARERAEERWRRRGGGRDEEPLEMPVTDGDEAGDGAADPPRAARLEEFDFGTVEAWQPVVLASEQRCAVTGERLAPGARAYLALGPEGSLGRYVAEDALA